MKTGRVLCLKEPSPCLNPHCSSVSGIGSLEEQAVKRIA